MPNLDEDASLKWLDDGSSDDEEGENVAAAVAKDKGNAAFAGGRYEEASKHFTLAINLDKNNHVLYSNRSACWCAMGFGEKALNDADACVKRAPKWAKGHSRRGAALEVLGRDSDAVQAYRQCLSLEPDNAAAKEKMQAALLRLRDGKGEPEYVPPPGGKEWLEAAKRGDRRAMEPLLKAEPSLLDYRGKGCPLGFIGHSALRAAAKGHAAVAKWLVAQGHPVSIRNNGESTPLHAAAQNGHASVAQVLVDGGADTTALDASQCNPRTVALEKGHSAVVRAIDAGAKQGMLVGALKALAITEPSSWKVGEMKKALKLGGVDASAATEKRRSPPSSSS